MSKNKDGFEGYEVLAFKMNEDDNDAGASTIRDYLKKLLEEIWAEGESFSGKRPFGNSGWEYELYKALCENGAIKMDFDEYGEILQFREKERAKANRLIFKAIEAL